MTLNIQLHRSASDLRYFEVFGCRHLVFLGCTIFVVPLLVSGIHMDAAASHFQQGD